MQLEAVTAFLGCPTPARWVEAALAHPEELLIDHANCEKKAASTALNLMFRYVGDYRFLGSLSRLAREELRHFEQVIGLLERRGIGWRHLPASRYAAGLRALVRTTEPARLIDLMIANAFIEARSCERFAALAPHLDEELQAFYTGLLKSESRHFGSYLAHAQRVAGKQPIEERIAAFRAREAELIEAPDADFQFHSGPPGVP